jgi:hypothetical protein
MTDAKAGGKVRRAVTRVLAGMVLVGIYMFNTIALTGVVMTTGVSSAAARGRGRGRGYRGRGRGRGNVGAAIGAGVAIGIIGGAIAADAARRNNAVGYCASRFRSYDPASGTYLGNDGYRHPCP